MAYLGEHGAGFYAETLANVGHGASKFTGLLHGFHKGSLADFDVKDKRRQTLPREGVRVVLSGGVHEPCE